MVQPAVADATTATTLVESPRRVSPIVHASRSSVSHHRFGDSLKLISGTGPTRASVVAIKATPLAKEKKTSNQEPGEQRTGQQRVENHQEQRRKIQTTICQQTKVEHVAKTGYFSHCLFLTGLEIITMDFIEGLPTSLKKNCILVVDKFTKYSHFVAISHPYTAAEVAKLYLDNIYKLHGQPKVAISDRDKTFTSLFWKELMRKWWYNTTYHTALKLTPFQALYGYAPPTMVWQSDHQCILRNFAVEMKVPEITALSPNNIGSRKNLKLAARYYGPYKLQKRLGRLLTVWLYLRHHVTSRFPCESFEETHGQSAPSSTDPPDMTEEGQFPNFDPWGQGSAPAAGIVMVGEGDEEHMPQAITFSPAKPPGTSIGAASMAVSASGMTYTGLPKNFILSDIERATNRFDESRMIDEGGCGIVYRGMLDNGVAVTVKVLKRVDQHGEQEFLAEVEMLSGLHHRNLVKMIGVDKETDSLDWGARMKIALSAARGLAYLHEDSSPRVIHRDIKSSNILLEHDFTPKVSDWLVQNFMKETNMFQQIYLAPEYAMTGRLCVKSDVYSYGVVLLELLTGRKPVDLLQPPGQENLDAWARPLLTAKEAAIASMCVQPEASNRPFMGEIVQALRLICNEFDEISGHSSELAQDSESFQISMSASNHLSIGLVVEQPEPGSFTRHFWLRIRRLSRGSQSEHGFSVEIWPSLPAHHQDSSLRVSPGDSLNVDPSTIQSLLVPRTLWSWFTTFPTWHPPWLTLALTLMLRSFSMVGLLHYVKFVNLSDCISLAAIRIPLTHRCRSQGWLK
ncbi:Receptor-like serine/threonine-protein kinase ALE2 [Hibiscus syriacus]|uniref:non-specific serine/threonine protein kinase n=1 Tax=Hibiscus syriacus TaxID=106335 RepID=A0A6A2YIK2_HIBSY|nr:Receptor-like serine/threonine-protein kinase ALE2 [Hibiscus syriacus]